MCGLPFGQAATRLPYYGCGGSKAAEAGFEPFDDATNYYGEEDYADAFDDEGFSARYFDQE